MPKEKTLTIDEFQKFLEYLPKIEGFTSKLGKPSPLPVLDFLILYKLMFYCALRLSEVKKLKESDFSLDEKILKVHTSRTTKIQDTTIPPIILGDLRSFLKNKKDDEMIFPVTRQIILKYAQDTVALAGIEISDITEKRDSENLGLLVFRESYEKFLYEKKLEKGLVDLKLRNISLNRYGNYKIKNLHHAENNIFKTMFSDDEIQEYVDWYKNNLKLCMKLTEKINQIIEDVLESRKITVHNIMPRTKSVDSFRHKIMDGLPVNPKKMQDLSGIKIICYVKSDVKKIAQVIKDTFEIIRSKENLYDKKLDDTSGYSYNYYVCKFTNQRINSSEELQKFDKKTFEIQVRTILQNAWDEIEHDDVYKKDSEIANVIRRRFFLVANVLESADNELDNLHKEISEN